MKPEYITIGLLTAFFVLCGFLVGRETRKNEVEKGLSQISTKIPSESDYYDACTEAGGKSYLSKIQNQGTWYSGKEVKGFSDVYQFNCTKKISQPGRTMTVDYEWIGIATTSRRWGNGQIGSGANEYTLHLQQSNHIPVK